MRFFLSALVLLSAATLPTAAHANGIDDLVLTGDGHTLTFSLPSTYTKNRTHGWDNLVWDTVASRDGVGGYDLQLFASDFPSHYSLGFATSPDFSSDLNSYDQFYRLLGSYIFALISTTSSRDGYSLVDTFALVPGSYTETFYYTTSLGAYTLVPFTLTITPEAASPTPEPATLALLATGSLGLLTTLRRRLLP